MFFPEDIWIQIKAFLLLRMEGALFNRIASFQLENERPGFDLTCHVYYRMLHVQREMVLEKMLKFMWISQYTLSDINIQSAYMDEEFADNHIDDDDYFWDDSRKNQLNAYKCIQTMRHIDRFMNVYETASIQTLVEMLYSINEFSIFKTQENDDIRGHFRILHDCRRKIEGGFIDYIWEIEEESEIDKIQYLCCNPVIHIEKEGNRYVLAYSNGKSYWTTPFKQTTHPHIYMEWAKNLGKSFTLDYSHAEYSKFKYLLDLMGFPMANNYTDFPETKKIE